MPINRAPDFTLQLFDLLDAKQAQLRVSTIYLGGSSGAGGGSGQPVGGFVGQLAQKYVAYDTTEASLMSTGSRPSLLDNLNHIRYSILSGGSAGGLVYQYYKNPASVDVYASPGASGSVSRGDHIHFHGQLYGGNLHSVFTSASAGFVPAPASVAGNFLRDDGTWASGSTGGVPAPLSSVIALPLSSVALAGTSGSTSRYDHVHTHGGLTSGSLHALSTQANAGFLRQVTTSSGSYLDATGNWSAPSAASTPLSSTNPLFLGTASAGTSGSASRYDHVHPNTLASQSGAGLLRTTTSTSGSFLNSTGNWSVPAGSQGSSGSAYLLPFTPYVSLGPWGTENTTFTSTIYKNAHIVRWFQTIFVGSPNNGTNYWNIKLTNFHTAETLVSFDTSAMSADTWTRIDNGVFSTDFDTSMLSLIVLVTPENAPGDLYLHCPAVYVQE